MDDYFSLTLGMLCAGAGCELLLRGTAGLAAWLRIPPGIVRAIIGSVVLAGADISVVVVAAIQGRGDLALGAAVGACILNLGLVQAITIFRTRRLRPPDKLTCAAAVVAPLVVAAFAQNGHISRVAGLSLLSLFACWLAVALRKAWYAAAANRGQEESMGERRGWFAVSFCFVGVLLLASTGRLIFDGIEGLAVHFEIDFFVLGATLAPLCTTVPALTGAFIGRYRARQNLSTDRLLENTLLNAWLLGGLAAVIAPFRVSASSVLFAASCAALLALLAWPHARVPIILRGVALVAVYAVFLLYML